MTWSRGLCGAALAIAQCEDRRLRVMAGPGTGKSLAMQRRVARLLLVGKVEPQRILAVTFTRNAAGNLVQDLRAIQVPGCEAILSGTLHSFCFSLLGRKSVFAFLGRVPRPLITFNKAGVAQFEYSPMLEDLGCLGAFGGKRECTKRIHAFEAAWARLQQEIPGWPTEPVDQQFQRDLIGWLRFHEAILIGELVPEALRFLQNNPGAPELSAFDHVVVDEYQDLNKAEQVLLDQLSSNGKLSIVGDIDQSIYAFRFANPDGIVEFKQRHPTTHDEQLIECYRCPKKVVELADCLIRNNHPPTTVVRLNPNVANPDGEVHVVQWALIKDEAAGLATYVKHLVGNRGYSPGDILILCPRRLIGYGIRDALRDLGVPTHSFYHEEALESEEAQAAFTVLTLLVNPEDRVSLRFWLGLDSPTWRTGEYGRLREYCEKSGLSPKAVLDQLLAGVVAIGRTGGLQNSYRTLLAQLNALAGLSCADIVDKLLPANAKWSKALRELAVPLLMAVSEPAELLDEIKNQITQPELPEGGDFVRVMSLHKSKGLTCKVAIVAGCIEGLIPTTDADHTPAEAVANLQEQRRLFYVAMTRCREILVLSSVLALPVKLAYKVGARVRSRQGMGATVASRFLSELGPKSPPAVRGSDWMHGGLV